MDKVEFLILRNLLYNEEYVRKVLPFIRSDYFEDYNQKVVFEEISKFVVEYNQPATKEVLCIETEKRQDINDSSFQEITKLISYLEDEPSEFNWVVNTTEKWCRDRAIYLALMESIQLADGKDEEKDGKEVIGNIVKAKTHKSRLSKENKQVEIRLYYDERGLDKYYGLLELGEIGGLWKNVAGRYEMNGKKIYAKQILAEPETYFTTEVMQALDEIAQKEFSYGEN